MPFQHGFWRRDLHPQLSKPGRSGHAGHARNSEGSLSAITHNGPGDSRAGRRRNLATPLRSPSAPPTGEADASRYSADPVAGAADRAGRRGGLHLHRNAIAPLSALILVAVVCVGLVASIGMQTDTLRNGVQRNLAASLALEALEQRLAAAGGAGEALQVDGITLARREFQDRLREAGLSSDPALARIVDDLIMGEAALHLTPSTEVRFTPGMSITGAGARPVDTPFVEARLADGRDRLARLSAMIAARRGEAMAQLRLQTRRGIANGDRAQTLALIGVATSICLAAVAFLLGIADVRNEASHATLTAFRLGRVCALRTFPQVSRSRERVT